MAHYFLQKVTSSCTVSSYKVVQHLSERNMDLFSKRLTAVQNYKGVRVLFERNIEFFSKGLTAVQSSVKEV